MRKVAIVGLTCAWAMATAIACAAPTELEQGKLNLNMGVMVSPNAEYNDGFDLSTSASFYGGVTYGLGDKWGIQYDYSHYGASAYGTDFDLDANEFNVLYKLDTHLNVFAGYVYAGMRMSDRYDRFGANTDGFQAGLTGRYPLCDKVKTFGKIGLGNKSHVYEIGFSYAIADNWDIDLAYRDAEYKEIGGIVDMSYDGVRLGVSTAF